MLRSTRNMLKDLDLLLRMIPQDLLLVIQRSLLIYSGKKIKKMWWIPSKK
jgi:hypothetical protein